ncbi:UDP-N-acetylglucosamine--dolichyl-phosphate N-acetylglucosaminephosphotransferase-like [Trifolium pratense]|uniref:UDP-N-acetylglucosamine--dolichyl-phosphate N-acetylglucosaminephosphotransferase-like n=1 Tax=Trifolium pratense TaxID=57577 RepID=UPI001E697C43|nr:UDP-N-acetylglucosamine--dolichyl-phosphate N-acetylglucosaminephosphotransferase-like [Trifolium pratense]
MPRRNNNPRRQNNNPQQQVPDPPIAPPKWGVIFKLSLFSIPYFYLIFFHYSIDSEFRRSIIINAGLSLAGFFVTVRMIPVVSILLLKRGIYGLDTNKEGTPRGNVKVPESLGIVVAPVFFVVAILSQCFNFTADSNLMPLKLRLPCRFRDLKILHIATWHAPYYAAIACVAFITLLGFVDDGLNVPWRV